MKQYDAIIIGSGQGGGPLAQNLAEQGWKVALIEKEYLGGTCINYGCTPTKTMIASARIAHYARRAPDFGVHTGEVAVNLGEVVARKNKIVTEWRGSQEQRVQQQINLDLYYGVGRFTAPHTVEVNGQSLKSEHIFINTGARPRIPEIPGISQIDYLTNRNIMDLQEVPAHLIIIGGGYIGLEFGQMFLRFGSRVSIIHHGSHLLSREDEDVATALQEALLGEGMKIHLNAEPVRIARSGDEVQVTISSTGSKEEIVTGTHLLIATGRVPNSDNLGLENAGVETDERDFIKVNERLETTAPGVWAIGDVKGGPAFTHISYDDFLIVYDALIHSRQRTIHDRLVPYAVYTDPELGRVGLTEKEARKAGYRLKIGKIPMNWVARALERDETAGLMKVVIDADTERILGAAILGPEGGELVQILMTVMMADAPWTLLRKAVYIHPTLAEGFFALFDSVKEEGEV